MNTPGKYLDQFSRMLDPRQREIAPECGDLSFSIAQVKEKGIDPQARTVTAIVSTPNVDRYEEIVEPKAFEEWLPQFLTNPVFVAGHQYNGFSGEPTVIGHWVSMEVTDEGLVGTAKFADTKLADEYWKLYSEGHMRAFSVGWITHQWEMREYDLGNGVNKKIRVFTEVELIEVSAVSIPANRESLVRAASALAGQQDGNHDAEQSAAIAKALREEIATDIKQSIGELLPAELSKLLSAEPGSPLCSLVQDVVELTLASGSSHDREDVHDEGRSASQAQLEEVTELLSRAKAKLGGAA